MKKLLAILSAATMVLSLVACGAKTEEPTTAAPTTEVSTEATTVAATEATTVLESETASVEGESATDATDATSAESTAEATTKAPASKAEILAYYNNAVNKAYDAKVGFDKERTTDNENMDAGVALKAFKSLVYKFMGIGSENKYTESVSKGKWESETKKHFLRKSTLTEADLSNAKISTDGKNYTIVLDVKGGSSKAGKGNKGSTNAPLDKCGICVGNEDKGYYDHKTAPVIYDAIEDTYEGASISESYSNAKVTAVVDVATGNLVKLSVDFDIACDIDIGIGKGTATGSSHIIYKNFKY